MKMNGKRMIALLLCLATVFALCACSAKTAISTADFETKAKELGLTVTPVTEDMFGAKCSVAGKTDESGYVWQAMFYQFENKYNADFSFSMAKSDVRPTGFSSSSTTKMGDTEIYEMTSSDQYVYLARVGSTFLQVSVDKAYKDDVKALIKAINY